MSHTTRGRAMYFLFIVCFWMLAVPVHANFAFWIYPEDNNSNEIVEIEKKYHITSQLIGYTFDSFWDWEAEAITRAVSTFGKDRVYHVSLAPFGFSAKEVANGKYDAEYRKFFKIAKASGAKFLYRTMHEMNGSWYSWSGDPTNFKKAWIHIYELSREEGLDTQSILFIMSVNSQDLPTVDGSIGGKMISCSPINKKKTGCRSFEDYYPGNAYVDMMGMTLYNWGRGRGEEWAKWRSFPELLNDKNTKMLLRISSYGKPVFLDEVGTTAVNFKGSWSLAQAQQTYANDTTTKNEWISGFKSELFLHPQIVGAMYFNRDKTDGLSNPIVGELDWSVLSLRLDKEYSSVLDFWSDPRIDASVLPFKYDYPVVNGKKTGEKLAKKILNDTKNDAIKRQLKTKEELAKISLKIKNTKSKTMKRYWETVFSTMEVNLGK